MRESLVVALVVAAVLAGCIGNSDPAGKSQPINGFAVDPSFANAQPASVTGLEPLARLNRADGTPWPSGGGNFVLGDYVFGSALGNGFFIANISDPANPVLVFNETAGEGDTPFARKAEVIAHPDGRRTLVLATQSNGMHFWNVTDPANPEYASFVEFERNHYIAVVPGTELVFNNPSAGTGGSNTLIDAHDPYNPEVLGDFGAYGCHGTTFQGKPGDALFRGYCAAIQRTEVWDLTGLNTSAHDFGIKIYAIVDFSDNPIVGGPITNPPIPPNPTGVGSTPLRDLHHFATASADGNILIIGDEHRGGGNPGACFFYDETTGLSTPKGAVWFYDISDPANPSMLSWITPPMVQPTTPTAPSNPTADPSVVNQILGASYTAVPNCTAHFGQVIPGEDKLVIAWYSAGVLLIDFTNPAKPTILSQYQPEGVNVWSARISNGYVFTGDINRGMEVLKMV